MRRLGIPPEVDRAFFVLEEFADRAALLRDVDRDQGGFAVRTMLSDGAAEQKRYRGAEAPWAKLTDADVAELRQSDESSRAAGARLGVTPKTIRNARNGVTYVTEPTRPRCISCGAEWNMPNMPKVAGCKPTCPRYGKRLDTPPPAPFLPAPVESAVKQTSKSKGQSGHSWDDHRTADARLQIMRARERLEHAADAWLQTRDVAVRGIASPLAIRKIESEMEEAARALAKLRKDPSR